MTCQGSPRPLDALFDPRSIAILGASDDSSKWGHTLSRRALESSGDRPVFLVNRRGAAVHGRATHRTLGDACTAYGTSIDLVVVCVPATGFAEAVADSVAAGARAIVAITAGLSESGSAGARIEAEAVAIARAAGVLLVGPNCLGVVDTTTELQLSHDLLAPGSVAMLSQSGNLVLELGELMARRSLGISRFVSLGNQADLTVVDFLESCLEHAETRAVAIYAEDVVDGRAFIASARALVGAGKPVVLLAPGRSPAAARSAASHTGSLTSTSRVVDAACVVAGIHRVENPTQMVDLLEGLLGERRMHGPGVAVLTDGGGHGAIAADTLAAVGLESPMLELPTRTELLDRLWESSVVSNPVDLAGAGERDPMSYARGLSTLLAAEEVDGVLMTGYFGGYSNTSSSLAEIELAAAGVIADLVTDQAKPVVVHTIHPDSPSGRVLRSAGIPVHRHVVRACDVLAALVERRGVSEEDCLALPPAGTAVTDTSYAGSRALFAAAGVLFMPARTVRDGLELRAALDAPGMQFPLVLKATGTLHKSEGGGVVLDLRDQAQAVAAYVAMVARLDPPAVSVEVMADLAAGVEVIAGCVRDPRFGPVLMVGMGGIFTEVLADTAVALAPVSPGGARRLLLSLRGAPLLLGARGRDPVDLDALAAVVVRVSQVAASHPELDQVELNPILASSTGAVALDARVVAMRGPDAVPSGVGSLRCRHAR